MEGRIKNGRLEEIVHVHLHIKYAGGNVCMCAVECSIHNILLKPPMARNRSHTSQNTSQYIHITMPTLVHLLVLWSSQSGNEKHDLHNFHKIYYVTKLYNRIVGHLNIPIAIGIHPFHVARGIRFTGIFGRRAQTPSAL